VGFRGSTDSLSVLCVTGVLRIFFKDVDFRALILITVWFSHNLRSWALLITVRSSNRGIICVEEFSFPAHCVSLYSIFLDVPLVVHAVYDGARAAGWHVLCPLRLLWLRYGGRRGTGMGKCRRRMRAKEG
jgi:hypothetical protein